MELSFREMTKDDVIEPGDRWMEITKGMSGWFAVVMWMNDEDKKLGPFPEPWDTGIGRYRYKESAMTEALQMAQEEGLPYRWPKEA